MMMVVPAPGGAVTMMAAIVMIIAANAGVNAHAAHVNSDANIGARSCGTHQGQCKN